jgi:hypothetical protein
VAPEVLDGRQGHAALRKVVSVMINTASPFVLPLLFSSAMENEDDELDVEIRDYSEDGEDGEDGEYDEDEDQEDDEDCEDCED